MKIALKIIDIDKIEVKEIKALFDANPIGELEYNSSELTKTLNEIVFEFNYLHKDAFLEYLKKQLITGRILQ